MAEQKNKESGLKILFKNQIKIRAWLRDGLSIEEISKKIGLSKSAIYAYKGKNKDIEALFEVDKEINQFSMEDSLLKLVHGHKVVLKRPIKVKDVEFDPKTGRRIKETERIEYADYEDYKPPDAKACIFALTNRRPDMWNAQGGLETDDELNVKITVEKKNGP